MLVLVSCIAYHTEQITFPRPLKTIVQLLVCRLHRTLHGVRRSHLPHTFFFGTRRSSRSDMLLPRVYWFLWRCADISVLGEADEVADGPDSSTVFALASSGPVASIAVVGVPGPSRPYGTLCEEALATCCLSLLTACCCHPITAEAI